MLPPPFLLIQIDETPDSLISLYLDPCLAVTTPSGLPDPVYSPRKPKGIKLRPSGVWCEI